MSNAKTVVKRKKGDWRIAVLFLLPSLILLGLFVFWPMVDSIHMSFYDWNPLKGKIFTGLENYQNLLKDKLWWTSLGNTIKYILMNVPPIVIFSIIMCELVLFANNKSEVISKFIRGSFFLPCALSLVATGVAWRYLIRKNWLADRWQDCTGFYGNRNNLEMGRILHGYGCCRTSGNFAGIF